MRTFLTKASLVLAHLTAGQSVETLGYTVAGDGGGARYLIQTAAEFGGTPDGYSDHVLANGNVAVLQAQSSLGVADAGATGDGIADDTDEIQAQLDKGGPVVLDLGRNYKVTTLKITQANTSLNLNGATLTGSAAGDIIGFDDAVQRVRIFGHGKIDGNGLATIGINIDGQSQYSIKRVTISDIEITGVTDGIEFNGCEGLMIKGDVYIHDVAGIGIKNVENLVVNNFGSKRIIIDGPVITNTVDHGISINSWALVDDITISNAQLDQGDSTGGGNGIEIWAQKVTVTGCQVQDYGIAYSFGAVNRLTCVGNEADVTTPAASGAGSMGIEIGGCYYYNIQGNTLHGHRYGIQMTTANLAGGSARYDITGTTQAEQGAISVTDYDKLRILSTDTSLTGSYYGGIRGNNIVAVRNAGIDVRQEGSYSDVVPIIGNMISQVGKLVASSELFSCISVRSACALIVGNIMEGATYGINSNFGKCHLGANTFRDISDRAVTGTGGGHQFVIPVQQSLGQGVPVSRELALSRAAGTYAVGDQQVNHAPTAGGTIGQVCTEAGTISTISITGSGTIGTDQLTVSSVGGGFSIGVVLDIAGISGTRTVIDYNPTTLAVTLDSNLNATVSGASVTNHAPVFKSFGTIAV